MGIRVDQVFDKLGKFALLRKLLGQGTGLFDGRDLASKEEPEHAFRKNLLATWRSREDLLAVRDGQAMESDALR